MTACPLQLLRAFGSSRVAPRPDTGAPAVPRRRELLVAGPALLLGGNASPAAPRQPTDAPIDSRFLEFPDETAQFRAHFRFERDLRDQGQAVSWYHFTVYAVAPDRRPAAVVRFEGMEFSYFRRIARDTWRIHAHNLSFPREIATGAFTSAARNPVTGAEVAVEPMVLLEDPGVLHSPKGYLPLDSAGGPWLHSRLMFRVEGELVKVEHDRPTPAAWPTMFIESSTSFVTRREFEDPRITSLLFQTSGFYIFPWPRWMRMQDQPGHMLGAWSGRKLRSAAELPLEFRARAEREHPGLLQARWAEFDRPLSPVIQAQLKS
jgi:hypothetical protein